MPRIPVVVAALACTAVLALGGGNGPVQAQDQAQDAAQAIGHAPEIEIRAWIRGDGLDRLEDFRGQVVLLEFWNTH